MSKRDIELGVNAEQRRAGEVAIGILGEPKIDGFVWVTIAEAREFMGRLRVACRDSEDWAGDDHGQGDDEARQ